jgi:hypothetical protein
MARCGCTQSCACAVAAGTTETVLTTVTGNGSAAAPYTVLSEAILVPDGVAPLVGPNALKESSAGLYVDPALSSSQLWDINVASGNLLVGVPDTPARTLTLMTSSANVTVTLPAEPTGFPVGTAVHFARMGVGEVSVVAAGGAVVNGTPGPHLASQYSVVTAIYVQTNVWLLFGDLKATPPVPPARTIAAPIESREEA